MVELYTGPDGQDRCKWCAATPAYVAYHDTEWGYPVANDRRLFEKLCLESFQSGLSWLTILNKRDNFRAAFDNFDIHKMAAYGPSDVDRLLGDAGIVRHRGKINAVINNAARCIDLTGEFGSLAAYVWSYEPKVAPAHGLATHPASLAMSKNLKKRGWKFVGPTTVYAFMQAMGLVNDHAPGCAFRAKAAAARAGFTPPN